MKLRTRAVAAAVLGLSLGGCKTIPLGTAPFASASHPVPAELYSVQWWEGLVTPPPFEYAPTEAASPAVDPDSHAVVVLTRDGQIRALEGQTGKELWKFKTHNKFNAGALIQGGVAYVAGGDGVLYALEMKSGKALWSYDCKEELATTPTVAEGIVVVASQTDTVFAVEQQTGKWKWQYRRDTPSGFTVRGASRPSIRNGLVYAGFSDGYLAAVRVSDGAPKWERELSAGTGYLDIDSAPVFDAAGRLYVVSYKDGVFQLDPETGDTKWNTQAAGLNHLILAGGRLYASGDEQVIALLPDTGVALWTSKIKNRALREPSFARGLVLVPTSTSLMFLDANSGRQRLSWNPGVGITAPAEVVGGRVYVLSNNGYIYSMLLTDAAG